MRFSRAVTVVLAMVGVLLAVLPLPGANADVSDLYQRRCSACHGIDGRADTPAGRKQGVPSFNSDAVRNRTINEIQDYILSGGNERRPSHVFSNKGISESDGLRLAAYVKELGNRK